MGKRIVVISGSPRSGGNSDILCDQFVAGARDAGHEAQKITLRDKHIGFCKACDACVGDGVCTQHDDMEAILDQMVDADVIVMATPVYFYAMNGQMKTLIDRTYARYTRMIGKKFYFIMAAAADSRRALDRTLEQFRGFTDCLPGSTEEGVVYATRAWARGDVRETDAMREAYELGRAVK